MADCIIKPSFLRGFDFKLLHATDEVEEYRKLSVNPFTGEVLALPFGHRHILQSFDGGQTFVKRENALPEMANNRNVVLDTTFGLNRHALLVSNNKAESTATAASGFAMVLLATNSLVAEVGNFATGNVVMYARGVDYANGCFMAHITAATLTAMRLRWYNGEFTTFSNASSGNNPPGFYTGRFGLTRGAYVYTFADMGSITASEGESFAINKQAYPVTGVNLPLGEHVSYLVNAETGLEIADTQNYTGVLDDGAVAIERNGKMWRATAPGLETWVGGGEPPTLFEDTAFPHVAAGRARFNEPVLLSIDLTGNVGLLSVDHGETLQSFELPPEIGATLPGGIQIYPGVASRNNPRVYDIQYVPDPGANFTRGRWVMAGGYMIWELIPRYGE